MKIHHELKNKSRLFVSGLAVSAIVVLRQKVNADPQKNAKNRQVITGEWKKYHDLIKKKFR